MSERGRTKTEAYGNGVVDKGARRFTLEAPGAVPMLTFTLRDGRTDTIPISWSVMNRVGDLLWNEAKHRSMIEDEDNEKNR
jgi:hypothetical protein